MSDREKSESKQPWLDVAIWVFAVVAIGAGIATIILGSSPEPRHPLEEAGVIGDVGVGNTFEDITWEVNGKTGRYP